MIQYLDRNQVIELYEKFQPSLATHIYEFGEKLKALPIVEIPIAELDTTKEERPHGEWIEDIRSMICKVNDYYGYTDSMHMFKVLFDQKYHGWKKEGEAE